MIIGVPKEVKNNEYRVGLTSASAGELVSRGNVVYVEKNAGTGSGISNDDYLKSGAKILDTAAEIYGIAEMIVKVKEPMPCEYELLKKGQIVFTYFHFAANRTLTEAMLQKQIVAIAYETMTEDNKLPLLEPMSEIAGRIAVQEGARYLEKFLGGSGVLLGGVPGVKPGKVMVLGGGVVGTNSALIAAGFRAEVIIFDINLERLRFLDMTMPANVKLLMSNRENITEHLKTCDLVIGGVLIPGARAPHLITRKMLSLMKPGSVIVDVAVDQGGCVETCKPTTHSDPVYEVDGIIHYCVANMPGAVPQTSTIALNNATLPYAVEIAKKGYMKAAQDNMTIATGINMINGVLTCEAVGQAFDMKSENVLKFVA